MSSAVWLAAVIGWSSAAAGAESRKRDSERMEVMDVISTDDEQFVVILKTRGQPTRILPIWIGESEALAIRMRLERRDPPRPLTLNLLESVLASGNIKLLEVKIDAVKDGVFLGRLRLRQAGRAWDLDARPSDAIGLAVGSGAAIWVARPVLDAAAVNPEGLGVGRIPAEKRSSDQPVDPRGYEETL